MAHSVSAIYFKCKIPATLYTYAYPLQSLKLQSQYLYIWINYKPISQNVLFVNAAKATTNV